MADLEGALDFASSLVKETHGFSIETFQDLRARFEFNLDRVPCGPESTEDLEAVGGFPEEVLRLVREVGRVTLNVDCCFVPTVLVGDMEEKEYFGFILENLGLRRDQLRLIGGDHGDGRWGIFVPTGNIIFFEIDDDYGRKMPSPCFENFANWLRVNFILGLVENRLEQEGADIPRGHHERVLEGTARAFEVGR